MDTDEKITKLDELEQKRRKGGLTEMEADLRASLVDDVLDTLCTGWMVNESLWRDIDEAKEASGYAAYWADRRMRGMGGFTFAGYLRHLQRRASPLSVSSENYQSK